VARFVIAPHMRLHEWVARDNEGGMGAGNYDEGVFAG
jgi:hypothetical protein